LKAPAVVFAAKFVHLAGLVGYEVAAMGARITEAVDFIFLIARQQQGLAQVVGQ